MKLLLDENLSPRLPLLIATAFPESQHLRDCGLKGATDEAIWNYARANDFTLVSKDSDFYHRSIFHGSPPKFIWLRIGNCTRADLVNLLLNNKDRIEALASDPTESILILY